LALFVYRRLQEICIEIFEFLRSILCVIVVFEVLAFVFMYLMLLFSAFTIVSCVDSNILFTPFFKLVIFFIIIWKNYHLNSLFLERIISSTQAFKCGLRIVLSCKILRLVYIINRSNYYVASILRAYRFLSILFLS